MSVLSAQTIRRLGVFEPCHERTRCEISGMTYGLSPSGYDLRIAEDIVLRPGEFSLASAMERIRLPRGVVATVHDKSTLARMGLAVQTTVAEPGWRGYLTLELSNNHPVWAPDPIVMARHQRSASSGLWREYLNSLESQRDEYNQRYTIVLRATQPIAQVLCHELDEETDHPYEGRYQNQEPGPQAARLLSRGESR